MTQTLVQKLGIKANYKLLILNAPKNYLDSLVNLPEGVQLETTANGHYDFVQAFVKSITELEQIVDMALKALKPGGILYFSYPKKSGTITTDLSRDEGWNAITARGYAGVRLISIDATWSSFRVRPVADIKSTRKA